MAMQVFCLYKFQHLGNPEIRVFNNKRTKYETTIISHRNCIFNDEYTNDYSILSGESGTILTLINGIYLSKEYPKLLMID